MQPLPGFRDLFPEDCARRNYILQLWRATARRYAFVEYDGPVVEPLALYEKKSGGELVGQLFGVTPLKEGSSTKGALRPEMTPTLARMVAARQGEFRKPLRWFCVPQFFRHERQQRGRGREFYQLNCDIIGEAGAGGDAELIAVLIDSLRAFGFTGTDVVVRLSSRTAWLGFFHENAQHPEGAKITDLDEYTFLQAVDKAERAKPEVTEAALAPYGIPHAKVMEFMRSKTPTAELVAVLADLQARGLGAYVEIDYAIVRGLAYYTGVVFEAFDRGKRERALAGGGRYDTLLGLLSDGETSLPALGFGLGDVVLLNLINDTPHAKARMDAALAAESPTEIYLIIAREERRPDALALAQRLRDSGKRVDFPLAPSKVGKQFQAAEAQQARIAILLGDEWPQVKVKTLATREELLMDLDQACASL